MLFSLFPNTYHQSCVHISNFMFLMTCFQQFSATKLSLNKGKAKFTQYDKPLDNNNLPLQPPNLRINNYEIKRSSSVKVLAFLVDVNLTWVDHITVQNKLSKNLGLLYKAKNYLNKKSLVNIQYSFICSYLNYGNISWCNLTIAKLKKLASKQNIEPFPMNHSNSYPRFAFML